MKKKVVIVTARAGYPNGFGASSILRKYASGFGKNGFNTSILLLRPTEIKGNITNRNIESKGLHNNVEFEYLCGTVYTSKHILVRIWLYFIGVLNAVKYIITNRDKIERLFFYSPDYLISTLVIQILCILLKIKCIGIKTESSLADIQRTKNKFWKIKEVIIYRLFSSMIVITSYLKKQLSQYISENKIFVIPIIVDEEMFNKVDLTNKNKTLIYMGTLNYREELYQLLESYSIIHKEYKDWTLKIVGGFLSQKLENEIHKKARDLNIDSAITWVGVVNHDNLASILGNGGIMLLPRIGEEYSKAGFPIKLGEYLLSGAPTIVTNTGDIGHYLEDNTNAFIVRPNDARAFALKTINVIEYYREAKIVGEKGRELAIKKFGSKEICKRMLSC